jgi:hypothetical protein
MIRGSESGNQGIRIPEEKIKFDLPDILVF